MGTHQPDYRKQSSERDPSAANDCARGSTGADANLRPFIEGLSVCSQSSETVDVINPSNGRRLFSIPAGCNADTHRAVVSARAAFDERRWSGMSPSGRGKSLSCFAELIDKNAAEFDLLDAEEMGKPISTRRANAAVAAGLMRFYAEAIGKVMGSVFSSDRDSFVSERRVPRGVIAAVVPWNFPTYNAVLKVAPALAAGNTVVLKPSELASRSGMRLAHLAIQAGVPPGVFNVVPGRGDTTGRALSLHMNVDMISFTGSTQIGNQMLVHAGQSNMKFVLAECGGKSPQIVFDDGVDLEAAAESIASSLLTNQGQICSVGSRLIVQRSIEKILTALIVRRMERAVMGDATDPNTTFGPLASVRQCTRVLQFIERAVEEGASLVCGGRRTRLDTGGFFVEPTVLSDVAPHSEIAQEEVFGPVLTVIPFDDEEEAVRLANGTKYGLIAYVWTSHLATAMRMADAIRSGVIVNAAAASGEGPGHGLSVEPYGQSGLGTEGGLAGMESYMRRLLAWINYPGLR